LDEKSVQTLIRLGLSGNQAKVYLSLVDSGYASVSQIKDYSKIGREEVYRKLVELRKLGLVEFCLEKKALYNAIPLELAAKILLKDKSDELSETFLQVQELITNSGRKRIKERRNEEPYIALIPKEQAHIDRAKNELEKLEASLDALLSFNKARGWIGFHERQFRKALDRKIKIRWIVENGNKIELPNSLVDKSFEIRTISDLPPACFGIYDHRVLLIDTSSTSGFLKTPVLLTNNPGLIALAQTQFEKEWNSESLNCITAT
jgi:sugar-specific transcriptional regulator TrmB